jgi:hypothetical protein
MIINRDADPHATSSRAAAARYATAAASRLSAHLAERRASAHKPGTPEHRRSASPPIHAAACRRGEGGGAVAVAASRFIRNRRNNAYTPCARACTAGPEARTTLDTA